MSLYYQVLSTGILCYFCLHVGIISAWLSSTVLIFTSNDTTLNRPMSQTEVSLFGSLQAAGAAVGTAISSLLLDKLGRKKCTVLCALAFVEAAKSIAFYKRKNKFSKEVLEEISKIRRTLYPKAEEMINLTIEETTNQIKERGKPSVASYYNKLLASRKQMVISLILMSSNIFQGLPMIQVYMEPLFMEVVPSDVMSANLCSVLTAILAVLAGIVSAYLTDALGRRPLIILSSVITGVVCIIIGTQVQLQWGPKWLSVVALFFYIVFYIFGAGTIPFVTYAEVFLPEVKSIMVTLVSEWAWFCIFMMVYIFPPAMSSLGEANIFYFFGVMCFLTSVLCVRMLPETKCLSVDAIQEVFNKS